MSKKVTHIKNKLYEAFQADHAELGRGLYNIRMLIPEGYSDAIPQLANAIIQSAGAHIAFEEFDFYPALRSRLSEEEVSRMYLEHAEGLALLQKLSSADETTFSSAGFIAETLSALDNLDHHVADCGNLFGAMGGLTDTEYVHLMDRLSYWRERAPSWSEIKTIAQTQKAS